jgi:hypothetical protein
MPLSRLCFGLALKHWPMLGDREPFDSFDMATEHCTAEIGYTIGFPIMLVAR